MKILPQDQDPIRAENIERPPHQLPQFRKVQMIWREIENNDVLTTTYLLILSSMIWDISH